MAKKWQRYKCPHCGINAVASEGEICPECAALLNNGSSNGYGMPAGDTDYGMPAGGTDYGMPTGNTDYGMPTDENSYSGYGDTSSEWTSKTNTATDKPVYNKVHQPNRFTGMVSGVHCYSESPKGLFLKRWSGSVFGGDRFSLDPYTLTFRIITDIDGFANAGSQTARNVKAYVSEDAAMALHDHDRVTVFGKPKHGGMVLASAVRNESTMQTFNGGINPWGIRLISVVLAVFLYSLLSSLFTNGLTALNGMNVDWGQAQEKLIYYVVILAIVYIVVKDNPRLRKILLWIAIAVIGSAFCPEIGGMIIMFMGLKLLLTGKLF